MPSRYWSIFAALVGVGSIAGGVGYGLVEQARYADSANYRAAKYAEHAANKITQSCLRLPTVEQAECFHDGAESQRLEARDKQREYDDLVAQRTSALWTKIMGIAALIGMALSVVGVFLVYTTFRETRKANEISEDTARRQLRAYVGPSEFGLRLIPGKPPSLDWIWFNAGETPAFAFTYGVVGVIVPKAFNRDEIKLRIENREHFKAKASILPGRPLRAGYDFDQAASAEFINDFKAGEVSLMVAGFAVYRDAFGRRRLATFKRYADGQCAQEHGRWQLRNCVTGNRFN